MSQEDHTAPSSFINCWMTEREMEEREAMWRIAEMGWRNEVEQDRWWQMKIAEGMSAKQII